MHPDSSALRQARPDLASDLASATRGAVGLLVLGGLLGLAYAAWRLDPNRRK